MNIREFVAFIQSNDGTFDVQWDTHGNPEFYSMVLGQGYMVSTRDGEMFESCCASCWVSIEKVWDFIADNRDNLDTYYLGVWSQDSGDSTKTIYLDVSMNIGSLGRAIELGESHKQIAIWDNANRVAIPVTTFDYNTGVEF